MQAIMQKYVGLSELTTTITVEPAKIYTSRLLDNKMYSLEVELDGTVADMIAKCERVNSLDNELYKQFSELAHDVDRELS